MFAAFLWVGASVVSAEAAPPQSWVVDQFEERSLAVQDEPTVPTIDEAWGPLPPEWVVPDEDNGLTLDAYDEASQRLLVDQENETPNWVIADDPVWSADGELIELNDRLLRPQRFFGPKPGDPRL